MPDIYRIGVLTGGGDTPALNATLCGILRRAEALKVDVYGFLYGWAGLLDDGQYAPLTKKMIDPKQGGTILKELKSIRQVLETMEKEG